jgi:organic hydroperoxide reductase OsmC/OhrA
VYSRRRIPCRIAAPADFQVQAEKAKAGCPVSKALAGTSITLTAKLL